MSRTAIGTGEALSGTVPATEILTFNREGTRLAIGGAAARLWTLGSEAKPEQATLQGTGTIFSLGFSTDNRLLACGCTDGSVHIWDTSRPAAPPRVLREHLGPVITTVFAADGTTFYSAANDGRLIRWRLPAWTKQDEWRLPGPIHRGDFAPDARHFFTANANGTVSVLRLTP